MRRALAYWQLLPPPLLLLLLPPLLLQLLGCAAHLHDGDPSGGEPLIIIEDADGEDPFRAVRMSSVQPGRRRRHLHY